ncbi:MAG TPA: methylated-DNA--[protein]-cysteine S-methyltransferase [Thermoguttaceae bacterium]
MKKASKPFWFIVFPSSIGWFAILGINNQIKELTFGHKSAQAAKKALTGCFLHQAQKLPQKPPLIRRFQAYIQGTRDDFSDIKLDLGTLTNFQRRIFGLCRKIPFGTTVNYGRLAAMAGSPRAGRAVGNCMAKNKVPIIIPCHRVVGANGHIGSYSAYGGTRMKKRLLALENLSKK